MKSEVADVLASLSPCEQHILLVSALFNGVSRTRLIDTLNILGVKDSKSKRFTPPSLHSLLKALQDRDLVSENQGHWLCDQELTHFMVRRIQKVQPQAFYDVVAAIREVDPYPPKNSFYQGFCVDTLLRELRLTLYEDNYPGFLDIFEKIQSGHPLHTAQVFPRKYDFPCEIQVLRKLETSKLFTVLDALVANRIYNLENCSDILPILEKLSGVNPESPIRLLLARIALFRSKLDEASEILSSFRDCPHSLPLKGLLSLLQGKKDLANKKFKKFITHAGKQMNLPFFVAKPELLGWFFCLFDAEKNTAQLNKWAKILDSHQGYFKGIPETLRSLMTQEFDLRGFCNNRTLSAWLEILIAFWSGHLTVQHLPGLELVRNKARMNGWILIADDVESVIASLATGACPSPSPGFSLYKPKSFWSKTLESIQEIYGGKEQEERIIWQLSVGEGKFVELTPQLQKKGKNGWSKGRNLNYSRLIEGISAMSEQDHLVARAIHEETYGWRYRNVLSLNIGEALTYLVSHPRVFSETSDKLVTIEEVKPQLILKKSKGGYHLQGQDYRMSDYRVESWDEKHLCFSRSDTRYQELVTTLRRMPGLPGEALAELLTTLDFLDPHIEVLSQCKEISFKGEGIMADPYPSLHISQSSKGIRVDFRVQPFGEEGPAFFAGQGSEKVQYTSPTGRLQTQRDFKAETQELLTLLESFDNFPGEVLEDFEYVFETRAEFLPFLETLASSKNKTRVFWPEGKPIKVKSIQEKSNVSIRVSGDSQGWLEVEGSIHADRSRIVSIKKLLDDGALLRGRFFQLSENEYISLTDDLKTKVSRLKQISQETAKGFKIHPVFTEEVQEIGHGLKQFKTDGVFKNNLARLLPPDNSDLSVPFSFQANLRNYQLEGYIWLKKILHWGFGACLADDMGLGKTIQALALLLDQASKGPSLVVAPLSVCHNWIDECRRFAPELNPILFHGTQRENLVEELGKNDLLITSYGIMVTEILRLNKIDFNLVILDEAQAIKNRHTQRHQAAQSLKGSFRLTLSGTPIENNVMELHSLMDFINPGLLGGAKYFAKNFAVAIEQDRRSTRAKKLKKMISPFMLRRQKSEVLQELPPKTEITHWIDLEEEERAHYEAIREKSLEKLSNLDLKKGGRIEILAEIMRLRRLCCHPQLVLSHSESYGSKIRALENLLEELSSSHHRVLIYSQFIDFLRLVKKSLERKSISYQYLDGSTPLSERRKRVEAFQSGECMAFLISLKAGGTGLNLTAADYVIHLDPWWNPAVEDQASDRAHRIGQQRPVTVYRLVTKDTIEEKILKLHANKRELIDNLLAGNENAAQISSQDLYRLLKETTSVSETYESDPPPHPPALDPESRGFATG
jgi:SNF2 family DNA or RNA helicase